LAIRRQGRAQLVVPGHLGAQPGQAAFNCHPPANPVGRKADRDVFPVAAGRAGDPAAQWSLEQIGPMSAAMDSMATAGLRALPLTPWQGLGVVALWAAGALVLGGLMLRLRDA
jgi:ABC-2 type transport system permease protein